MTCREFKHVAASFSLKELTQQQDAQTMSHVSSCPACEAWMEKQRSLNASLHALRMRTAGLEAGPSVEGALLRVFRQGTPVATRSAATAQLAVVGGRAVAGVKEPKSQAAPHSTSFALRLSRFFEVGAYAAVAAALLIAILLGLHLFRQSHPTAPVESKSIPAASAPATQHIASASPIAPATTARLNPKPHVAGRYTSMGKHFAVRAPVVSSASEATADEPQSDADSGYVALMFCDPLSCASDTQIVRMELPDATTAQPQVADVVVGYDGIVRAVRFVN